MTPGAAVTRLSEPALAPPAVGAVRHRPRPTIAPTRPAEVLSLPGFVPCRPHFASRRGSGDVRRGGTIVVTECRVLP